jgi:hypothetical protein
MLRSVCFSFWLVLFSSIFVSASDRFQNEVLPILETHCFGCHSHATEISGGLALDYASGWKLGGDRGPAIVPSDPDASILIHAVERRSSELAMPPEEPLSSSEIETLRRWIADGAEDPRVSPPTPLDTTPWWSLLPIVLNPIPSAVREDDAENPIDRFLAQYQHAAGIQPSEGASRRELHRRLSVDLLGVTPSEEEYTEFKQDDAPGAYERLVDRTLASPKYGERWARHWLDWIHFADSHGFEHDVMRMHAWRYRDYVIECLNADLPWPEWVRQQLAADVLYPDRPELTPALGFLAAGPWDQSTAATAQQTFDYIDRDIMLTQTMSVLTSTTVHCARCHNHKFDPIPQADYYALQAVFAGVGRGHLPFDTDSRIAQERAKAKAWSEAARTLDSHLLQSDEVAVMVRRWEDERRSTNVNWIIPKIDMGISTFGTELSDLDGTVKAGGPRPEQDTYVMVTRPQAGRITGVRLDVLHDDSLPMQGPGRNDNGNLHLSELVLEVVRAGSQKPLSVRIKSARADFDQDGWTIAHAIDGNPKSAWGIYPKVGQDHAAVFDLESPLEIAEGDRLIVQLRQLHGGFHTIGKFRLSITDAAEPMASLLPLSVLESIAVPEKERSREDNLKIAAFVLAQEAERLLESLPEPALVYAAGPRFEPLTQSDFYKPWDAPKSVFVLKRGNIETPGEEAVPGSLRCLSHTEPLFNLPNPKREGDRRLALARWITHEENPLFWRSIVNRLWLQHFGTGIVDTPNDFGRMGSLPSHPELLDWMADNLRRNGGSIKHLHRLMVTSAAYRRSSTANEAMVASDPDNRLVARWIRRRLDAEVFRDSLLQLAGTLDHTTGGPAVPWFRIGPAIQVTPSVDYVGYDWRQRDGNRRAIYRFVYRGQQDPFMEALDFPDAAQLAPQRIPSSSPLQALALWNHDFVLYACQRIAERVLRESASDPIRRVFRMVLLREPGEQEFEAARAHVDSHSLPSLVRILVNSNEFLFLD